MTEIVLTLYINFGESWNLYSASFPIYQHYIFISLFIQIIFYFFYRHFYNFCHTSFVCVLLHLHIIFSFFGPSANGIILLISRSMYLILVYRNTIGFSVYFMSNDIADSLVLEVLFIFFSSDSLGFSMYTTMSSANRALSPFFPPDMYAFYFLFLPC